MSRKRIKLSKKTFEEYIKLLDVPILTDEANIKQWLKEWLTKPNPALGNVTPQSLMDTKEGVDTVRRSLGVIFFGNCS
ncbi:MAG: MbcA/ParS/Xre antitoxin family protein [Candidatus Paceibacterota bacterium]|jgi:uncharacterized protein (DUF2384 family)